MPNVGDQLTKANGEYEWNGVAWTRKGSGGGLTPAQEAALNANTAALTDAQNATQAELDAEIARIAALEANGATDAELAAEKAALQTLIDANDAAIDALETAQTAQDAEIAGKVNVSDRATVTDYLARTPDKWLHSAQVSDNVNLSGNALLRADLGKAYIDKRNTFLERLGWVRDKATVRRVTSKRLDIGTDGTFTKWNSDGTVKELEVPAGTGITFHMYHRLGRMLTGLDGTDLSGGQTIVQQAWGFMQYNQTTLRDITTVGSDGNDTIDYTLYLNPNAPSPVSLTDPNNWALLVGDRVETSAGNSRISNALTGNGRGEYEPPAELQDWIKVAVCHLDEDATTFSYIENTDGAGGGGGSVDAAFKYVANEAALPNILASELIDGMTVSYGVGETYTEYRIISAGTDFASSSKEKVFPYSPIRLFDDAVSAIGQTIYPGEMLTYGEGTNGVNQIWWNHSDLPQTFSTSDFTNFTSIKGGDSSDLEDKQLTDGSTYNISNDLSEDGHIWYKSFNGQDLTVIFEGNTPADVFRVDGVGQAGPISLTGKKFLAIRSGNLVEILTFGGIRFFDVISDADNETFSDGEIVRTGWINEMQPYSGLWQFADGADHGDWSISNNSNGYFNLLNGNVTYLTFPQDFGAQEQAFFDEANQGNGSEFEIPLYYTEYNLRRHPQSAARLTFDIPTLAPIEDDDFGYHKYLRDKRTGAVVEITDSATGVIFDEVDLNATAFGTTSEVWQATAGTFSITQAGTYDIDINIVAALMLGGESSASSGTGGRIELRSADGATVYGSVNFGEEHHRLEDRAANLDEIPYSAGFRFLELQPGAYQFYYFSADGDGAGDRHTQSISGYARIKGFVGDTTTPTYAHFTFASSGENGFSWTDEISSNTFNHIANNGLTGITLSNGKYKVEYSAQKQTNSGTSVVNMRLNGANRYTGIATGPNAGAALTDVIDATTASQTIQFIRSASSGQGNTNAQLLITKIGG